MPREIPRTIRTLSPQTQRGIRPEQYEIIVVDNGSTRPFDRELCMQWGADPIFQAVASPNPSPCAAVNKGLQVARGERSWVLVDGARLVSTVPWWDALPRRRRERL